jgi:hypothetical protein
VLSSLFKGEELAVIFSEQRYVAEENRHVVDVVREQTDAPLDWEALKDEAAHFGSAQAFIDRVLGEASST